MSEVINQMEIKMKTFVSEQNAKKVIDKFNLGKNGMICEWGNADLSVWLIKLNNGTFELGADESREDEVKQVLA